ncbi:MAG: hypothetical protein OJF49_003226 [Ktedonobacterales bacterium]|jgi:hypothetical protein|nr:MAG: hypothetical protein OJF49_003226 [Ktedonobacterales bacterium]
MSYISGTLSDENAALFLTQLGAGWQQDKDYGWKTVFRGPDGQRLSISDNGTRTQVDVWLPDGLTHPHGMTIPTITVASSRGAAVIVREIERRIWPEYRQVLAEATRIKREQDAREQRSAEMLAELLDAARPLTASHTTLNGETVLDGVPHPSYPRSHTRIVFHQQPGHDGAYPYPDAVRVTIDGVPQHIACALLAFLAKQLVPEDPTAPDTATTAETAETADPVACEAIPF